MASITHARAYANNEVALVVWQIDAPIPDCRGFEITRIYASGEERVLPSWVPFEGQSNADWEPQTTSIWPVQRLVWRDLTARKRREGSVRRPADDTVRYRIRALVRARAAQRLVPGSDQPFGGKAEPLAYLDAGKLTDPVTITGRYDEFQAAFTNGILSAQWLTNALAELGQNPTPDVLKRHIADPNDPLRRYLTGDVAGLLGSLLERAAKEPGAEVRLALYELSDPELVELLVTHKARVRLILANSAKGEGDGAIWDEGNEPVRQKLMAAKPLELVHRMFNNAHIGHNKFAVLVDAGGRPTAVLTGSTNWTSTGLCAQSNNALVIDDPGLAHLYADYWQELKTDTHAFVTPAPLTEATHNVQSAAMRSANAVRPPELTLASGARVRLWKAPNTKNTTKGSAVPPDLSELYSLMRKAKSLVMFGVFLPGRSGKDNIIETALEIAARDPSLLVYGSISDPTAMPNYVPKGDKDTDDKDRAPNPSTYDTANVHVVRASALGADDLVGNFERELLKVGHAIIHDKIVVIDPLDADGCTIMGSHNLGFRASYTNDENLLIIQGQRALNLAYAVHLFDLYDHYRFRAVETELAQRGKHSRAGFLQRDDTWLTRASATSALADYFAQGAQGQRGE